MVEMSKSNGFLNSLKEHEDYGLYGFYKELKKINPPGNMPLSLMVARFHKRSTAKHVNKINLPEQKPYSIDNKTFSTYI